MRPGRSFTLVEMLIALALVVALVFVLLPATNRIVSSTAGASDRGHTMAQVAVLWDVVDRSLLTAVAQDSSGAPGVVGGSSSLRMTSCGVSLVPRDAARPDDLQTIEIVFDAGAITLGDGEGVRRTLLPRVEACRFEFNSGEGWSDDHGGELGLPRAVAVSIWLRNDEARDQVLAEPSADGFGAERGTSERAPDWRRVFAVFDPGEGSTDGSEGP